MIAAQARDTTATPAANAKTITWKGMTVDVTAIEPSPDHDAIMTALRRQIDIVDGAGLDARTMTLLKSVPVRLRAGAGVAGGNPGSYNGTTKTITLDAQVYPADHPILLHELMHAYHAQILPDGTRNAEILALYHAAVASGKWPADAYMLSNVNEYFAMMTSVYLFGSAARAPLTRDEIRKLQPDCYTWKDGEAVRAAITTSLDGERDPAIVPASLASVQEFADDAHVRLPPRPAPHRGAADRIERLHDLCLVRPSPLSRRPTVVRGSGAQLGNRLLRVHAAGASESDRRDIADATTAQGDPGSDHAGDLRPICRVRDGSAAEARSPVGGVLSGGGGVFRVSELSDVQ